MTQLDTTFIDEAGLASLSDEQKETMLAYVYKTLYARMGIRFATDATEEQLAEFEQQDEANIATWLETAFPNYDEVAEEELAIIKTELTEMAPDVLAA